MEGLRSKQPQGVSELCERTYEDADRKEALETLHRDVAALYPDYEIQIVPDVDMSD